MSKNEAIFTVITLAVIGVFAAFNLAKAQVLARDVQRKNDLKHIATALNAYLQEVGEYPQTKDGKMLACPPYDDLRTCAWGEDKLEATSGAFINPLPQDPQEPDGKHEYLYLSSTRNFQLFATLERGEDDEYNSKVVARNLKCGSFICNFGVSSTGRPEEDIGTFERKEQ